MVVIEKLYRKEIFFLIKDVKEEQVVIIFNKRTWLINTLS